MGDWHNRPSWIQVKGLFYQVHTRTPAYDNSSRVVPNPAVVCRMIRECWPTTILEGPRKMNILDAAIALGPGQNHPGGRTMIHPLRGLLLRMTVMTATNPPRDGVRLSMWWT